LNDQVAGCDALLAVLGPSWLHAKDETGQRRLDNPRDYVRVAAPLVIGHVAVSCCVSIPQR
jgi:hypothetical protein